MTEEPHEIGSGLLPSVLAARCTTNQEDFDINAQDSIMVHSATADALPSNIGVDVRQAPFHRRHTGLRYRQLGREYGVVGSNGVLTDTTLLGASMPLQATQRGRVALGHIGAGLYVPEWLRSDYL